jgi:hypothetical protein
MIGNGDVFVSSISRVQIRMGPELSVSQPASWEKKGKKSEHYLMSRRESNRERKECSY